MPGAAPLSRLTPTAPLTGEPSGWQALYKASPARGCGVERRLRRRKRDGAGLTVAEHKRASARAVRCGHRKPDGGCAARRRRRGALPLCGGDTRQSPAGPCPASVGDDARIVPQPLRCRKPHAAGEIARPTLRPRAGSNAQTPAIRQARRRAWCQPRRILARQGAAPLRRLGRHLPLQGRLYRRQSPQSLPCKGRWMRRKAQTEGCIAG